jgi:hypothetical protein
MMDRDTFYAALDRGNGSLARELLTDLLAKAQSRVAETALEAAKLEFQLGQIAEGEWRLEDAAEYFARASQLRLAAMSPDEMAAHDAAQMESLTRGFTPAIKDICRETCAEFGEPPCWKLPELVQPCEQVTPCLECIDAANGPKGE